MRKTKKINKEEIIVTIVGIIFVLILTYGFIKIF